jgi:hypothetical protein
MTGTGMSINNRKICWQFSLAAQKERACRSAAERHPPEFQRTELAREAAVELRRRSRKFQRMELAREGQAGAGE